MSEFKRLEPLIEYMNANDSAFGWKSRCEALTELAESLEAELADKDKQLADAKAEIERLKQLWSCNLDIIGGELNKQLADAKAEIERLKSEHEDSLRRAKDNAVSLSGTVTEQAGELLAKDKLIEQMREALASADNLIDEYAADYEHRDNVDEIREEIKAALAAERGE